MPSSTTLHFLTSEIVLSISFFKGRSGKNSKRRKWERLFYFLFLKTFILKVNIILNLKFFLIFCCFVIFVSFYPIFLFFHLLFPKSIFLVKFCCFVLMVILNCHVSVHLMCFFSAFILNLSLQGTETWPNPSEGGGLADDI